MSNEKEKDTPNLDEKMFTRLLEAAYVLQEHSRELQAMALRVESTDLSAREKAHPPDPAEGKTESAAAQDYTLILGQIVETQHQIQMRHMDLASAMSLVADRIREITHASGAAICLLHGRKVSYKAVSGSMAPAVAAEVPMEKALCVSCLRSGEVLRCVNVNSEFLLDTEECRRRGIQSLIAVPIYHNGNVAGGLELYYGGVLAFAEQDVHTCQLMAGLVSEALARDEELARRNSPPLEPPAVKSTAQPLKPKPPRVPHARAAKGSATRNGAAEATPSTAVFVCRSCGHELVGEEQFCGKCGARRGAEQEVPATGGETALMGQAVNSNGTGQPQNGASSVWDEREAVREVRPQLALPVAHENPTDLEEVEPQIAAVLSSPEPAVTPSNPSEPQSTEIQLLAKPGADDRENPADSQLARLAPGAWTSAVTTRAFLEQLSRSGRPGSFARFWNARRGDLYLAVAVILVACVIRWGIWPDGSVSATGNPNAPATASHRRTVPDADLSLFDRMLISLGLAEAPEPPESKEGNPDTPVWVDLRTAQYYCPGAEMYGKTGKGKFTTQREAQMDRYEPATRKACE